MYFDWMGCLCIHLTAVRPSLFSMIATITALLCYEGQFDDYLLLSNNI